MKDSRTDVTNSFRQRLWLCIVFWWLLAASQPVLANDQAYRTFVDESDQKRYDLIKTLNASSRNRALVSAVVTQNTSQAPPLITRDALAKRPGVLGVRLSPTGKHLAYVLDEAIGQSLWVMDIPSGQVQQRILAKMDRLIGWSSDGNYVFFTAGKAVAALDLKEEDAVFVAKLGGEYKGEYLGMDPHSPHHFFLSQKNEKSEFRLLRVSAKGESELVYTDKIPFQDFLTARDGSLAFLRRAEGEDQVLYLVKGANLRELARFDYFDPAALLVWDEDRSRIILRARLNRDLIQLLEMDPQTGQVTSLHKDPLAYRDMERAHVSMQRQHPILLRYEVHEGPHYYGGDPDIQKQVTRLQSLLPQSQLYLSPNLNTGIWLVQEKQSTFPHSRYHLFHTEEGLLIEILGKEVGHHPDEDAFCPKIPFSFRAGDDAELYGFVTLPPGQDLQTSPVVLMPHGGPFSRTNARFDYFVQFLANRGAIVVEPNFRGSTGHGRNYILGSKRDFGKGVVQQDILDSLFYILSLGIGDTKRLGIFGHSFGGFSVLCGLTFTPDLFQVGIAGAAPPDLTQTFLFMGRDRDMGQGITRDFAIKKYVVDIYDPDDVARLAAKSPANHGASISRPLLLLAGRRDTQVSIFQVRNYALELEQMGKGLSLFVGSRVGHTFKRPKEKKAYLYLLEKMLAKYLGMRIQPLEDTYLQRFITHQLVLDHHQLMAEGL